MSDSSELRLVSYNIHGLRDDVDAACAVIRTLAADVVCIQEAPRFLRWRSKRAAIARKSGLVVATADRPAGLMLMTSLRVKVVSTHFTLLSKRPNLHQRAVCSAVLEVGGVRWRVASVHLSLSAAERVEHLPEIWSAVDLSDDAPLVVAGDVNEEPDGPVWRELSTRLVDAWSTTDDGHGHTFHAASPHKRIDGIFVDPAVEVLQCRSVDDVPGVREGSDHLPVVAVLRHPQAHRGNGQTRR
jgi:endonuclease/exonuclease/phosphatase family metal-dependent hydrolase